MVFLVAPSPSIHGPEMRQKIDFFVAAPRGKFTGGLQPMPAPPPWKRRGSARASLETCVGLPRSLGLARLGARVNSLQGGDAKRVRDLFKTIELRKASTTLQHQSSTPLLCGCVQNQSTTLLHCSCYSFKTTLKYQSGVFARPDS